MAKTKNIASYLIHSVRKVLSKKRERDTKKERSIKKRKTGLEDFLTAPPPPLNNNDFYIKKSGIDPKGKGLYCTKDILPGTEVVGFEAIRLPPLKMDPKRFTDRQGWPHDAGIHALNGFWYDKNFSNTPRPRWYYLNHAYPKPLLQLKMRNGQVVWTAIKRIPADTELTFAYENKKDYFSSKKN